MAKYRVPSEGESLNINSINEHPLINYSAASSGVSNENYFETAPRGGELYP